MKYSVLLWLVLGLSGCAGTVSLPSESSAVALTDWSGRTLDQVQASFGTDGVVSLLPQGHRQLRIEQLWVVGVAGERYRTLQSDYPVKGGAGSSKESGGFNAKVLRCVYWFEWGADPFTVNAHVSMPQCPTPHP